MLYSAKSPFETNVTVRSGSLVPLAIASESGRSRYDTLIPLAERRHRTNVSTRAGGKIDVLRVRLPARSGLWGLGWPTNDAALQVMRGDLAPGAIDRYDILPTAASRSPNRESRRPA